MLTYRAHATQAVVYVGMAGTTSVMHDEAGKIQGVRYDELAPMLLNEVQKQQTKIVAQDSRIQAQEQKLAKLERANESMQAALTKLLAKDERVAMR
jgi:2C-methyl-D-erythritol 2,4-cyclodiphosphate synthase